MTTVARPRSLSHAVAGSAVHGREQWPPTGRWRDKSASPEISQGAGAPRLFPGAPVGARAARGEFANDFKGAFGTVQGARTSAPAP
jgi:hypothetical protein